MQHTASHAFLLANNFFFFDLPFLIDVRLLISFSLQSKLSERIVYQSIRILPTVVRRDSSSINLVRFRDNVGLKGDEQKTGKWYAWVDFIHNYFSALRLFLYESPINHNKPHIILIDTRD